MEISKNLCEVLLLHCQRNQVGNGHIMLCEVIQSLLSRLMDMWHRIGRLLLPRVVFWTSSDWFTGLKTCPNVMGLTGGSYPLCAWVMETQIRSCYCCSFGFFGPQLVWMINTRQTKMSLLSLVAIALWYGEREARHCLLRRVRIPKPYEIDLILIAVVLAWEEGFCGFTIRPRSPEIWMCFHFFLLPDVIDHPRRDGLDV